MGAEEYLPTPFTEAEIQTLIALTTVGRPTSVRPLKVTAAFHAIYILTYDDTSHDHDESKSGAIRSAPSTDLILRVSGDHIPRIKTENEAAILSWVRKNTKIPVPEVIYHDASTANPLGREFIILSRVPGVVISDIYDILYRDQLDSILKQLMGFLVELHTHTFNSIGGMMHSSSDPNALETGPVLDEHFWFIPDLKKYFPKTSETFDSVNFSGPFPTWVAYTISVMKSYIHVAEVQPALEFMREHITRLYAFLDVLPQHAEVLNNAPIKLVHKDMHFANILYDQDREEITAILDWEFAGTFPFPIWDLVRAFLWNGKDGDESYHEKYRLRDRFRGLCKEEGVDFFEDEKFTSKLQESMHQVTNMMRIIVTLIPRGQFTDRKEQFLKDLDIGLKAFGV